MTSKSPKQRWKNGLGYCDQSLFWNAIKKYGWDNFEHEILYEKLSKEEAEEIEKRLIREYQSNKREFGYNMADGGNVNRGYKLSHITKERLSVSHLGKEPWNKGLSGYVVPKARGKKRSEESCRKMSQNRPKKAVLQFTLNGELVNEFISMKDAGRKTGISDGSISCACSGRQKTAGGYVWRLKDD